MNDKDEKKGKMRNAVKQLKREEKKKDHLARKKINETEVQRTYKRHRIERVRLRNMKNTCVTNKEQTETNRPYKNPETITELQALRFFTSTNFVSEDRQQIDKRQEQGKYKEFAINSKLDNNHLMVHLGRRYNTYFPK